jgi:energy-coupling factor transporter ATP-binding protein EcfA2
MFLSSLTLRNVRAIESLTLNFATPAGGQRRWTLLLGENGCGKSTVLRAAALLLAGSDALAELLGSPDSWIRNGCKSCRIEATLALPTGATAEVALVLHRGDRLRDVFARNQAALDLLDAAIHAADTPCFVLGYGVSRRPGHAALGPATPAGSPRARGLATLFSADAPLVSLEQWATDLDYRLGPRALKPLRTALDRLLHGLSFARIDRQSRQLMFATDDGEVPLRQLSDSQQSVAAWCGDLLYRITEAFPASKDPLATRGLLLVDELDLHLHPVWRRRLLDTLSAALPHVQFIATTHSALTAQQSGEGELYVLRREAPSQRPTLVPFVGDPRRMLLHQLLTSPMFGLETLESVEVERARGSLRSLAGRRAVLSADERQEKARLAEVLRSAPAWDAVPAYAREQAALLQDIKASLSQGGRRPTLSVRKLKATAKALGAGK